MLDVKLLPPLEDFELGYDKKVPVGSFQGIMNTALFYYSLSREKSDALTRGSYSIGCI